MFVATLKNGQRLDFGGKCTQVDYKSERMVIFKNQNEKRFITLAIIPINNILTIINETEEELE